ncbi:hypothetical protein HPB50_004477 [Hyalomma asiaticum]|uniref:Uncharacterized protein n=1 Tax=Hyalomma asiaticum TaxID=266040 RepID=A0ACB7SDZ0_HYAAI|nr:hypothetical protein HPB50_004477 [Hyalomma asiaticum]
MAAACRRILFHRGESVSSSAVPHRSLYMRRATRRNRVRWSVSQCGTARELAGASHTRGVDASRRECDTHSNFPRCRCLCLCVVEPNEVWFQNRRSKERRMKQLSTLGARRHFFRSPRRVMRSLRPGMSPDGLDDSPEMGPGPPSSAFGYFSEPPLLFYAARAPAAAAAAAAATSAQQRRRADVDGSPRQRQVGDEHVYGRGPEGCSGMTTARRLVAEWRYILLPPPPLRWRCVMEERCRPACSITPLLRPRNVRQRNRACIDPLAKKRVRALPSLPTSSAPSHLIASAFSSCKCRRVSAPG